MTSASLSIDLDNKWSYMKTHGDAGWEAYPSYLDLLIPRVLDLMDELRVRITCFVVGRDALVPSAAEALASIPQRGHEVGNHSFVHEPWISTQPAAVVDEELRRAEEAIADLTGAKPIGFRAPGFARSSAILDVLARRGYAYDASSLPTFIGPLARAYYFRTSHLPHEELKRREGLFGDWKDVLRPNRPHLVDAAGRRLVEIPVTTFPWLRTPIHLSYVLYIATVSPELALAYFKTALAACRLAGFGPSILLHPLDFLDAADAPELAFFPAMSLDAAVKRRIVRQSLEALASAFDVRPLRDVAAALTPAPAPVAQIAASARRP